MKRLFFALWPDESVRQQCVELIGKINGYGRPVAAQNIHVTLLFLGSTEQTQQHQLSRVAASLSIQPMRLCFDGLSYWKKPAVCCLITQQYDRSVSHLVEGLRSAANAVGMTVEQRDYQPHITLLRKARTMPALPIEPIIWQSDSFCLVESCSLPTGVEYRVLERWSVADS